jgi:predicted PolB exonuclease-like 3'-5' exonuclease
MSHRLHIDIEKVPSRELTEDDIKVPGNMSKPETIAKWIAEEGMSKTIKDWSVDPLRCKIIAIGYSIDEEAPECLVGDDEKALLTSLQEVLYARFHKGELTMLTFSGYNLKGFDYLIIALRLFKYKLDLRSYFSMEINTRIRIFDIMALISSFRFGTYYSQDDVCAFLGLPLKDQVDGSKVFGLYKEGKWDDIATYCKEDVQKVVDIYRTFNR